jgi:hypothetical protein
MGLSHSPSIVSSNLILALDAANPKSYPGSGNTWFDITGRGNHGTLINGPSYSSNSGGFISCDGVNDYIEILDNSIFDFGSNNFSVEHWFRKNATSSNSNYWGVNKWNSAGPGAGTNEWFVTLGNSSSGIGESIQFGIESGSTLYEMVIPNTPTLYLWNQVVAIRSGAGLSVYLNGAMIGSSSPSGMASNTSVNNISGRNIRIANSALNNYYNKCDSSIVRIYRQALSADEVKQNYDATKKRYEYDVPIVTDGLILNLDAGNLLSYAGSGNSWVDVSKNNNIGLLVNGPTYSGSGSTAAIVFDGVNDYAIIQDNSGLALTSQGSLNVWFKLNSSSNQVIVSKGNVYADRNAYGIYIYNTQGIIGEIAGSATFNQVPTNSSFASTNVWRMATISWDSSLLSFYVNGSLIGKVSQTITPNTSGFPFVVGGNGNTTPNTFSASSISSVLAYNRALRSSEIYQNYNAMRSRYGL